MRRLIPPYVPQIPILSPAAEGTPRAGLAAIVTPDEAGIRYVSALHEHGWRALSLTTEPIGVAPVHFPYDGQLQFSGDVAGAAATLSSLDVQIVLAGSPRAVRLADELAARLALPGNDLFLQGYRTDIAETALALRGATLPTALTVRVHGQQTALPSAVFSQVPEVVLHHPDPAYSDAGIPCRSVQDLQAAWARLLETTPPADTYVLQERPPGMMYHLDTVTVPAGIAPEHRVTALWAQPRDDDLTLVQRFDLVRGETLIARCLSRCLQPALTALGVRFGPSRARMALLPDRGPVLLSVVPGPHPDIAVHTMRDLVGDAAAQAAHLATARRLCAPGGRDQAPQASRAVAKIRLASCPPAVATAARHLPTRTADEGLDSGPGPAWLLLTADDAAAIDRDVATLKSAATMP